MSMQGNDQKLGAGIPAITGTVDHANAIKVFPTAFLPYRSTTLAYGASILSTSIGFPLDAVKTRLQTHSTFTGYFDCIKKTYILEGLGGFYRGILAPLLSTSVSRSLSVLLYTESKPYCYRLFYSGQGNSPNDNPLLSNIPVCFISGMLAGVGVSVFASPFEFTKIFSQLVRLLQSQSIDGESSHRNEGQNTRLSTAKMASQIIKHRGLMGLYSGFRYQLLRDSVGSGLYYSVYESVKWSINQFFNKDMTNSSSISVLLAGGLSGVACWIFIFPLDTKKSLFQKAIVRNIIRQENGLPPIEQKKEAMKFSLKLYRGLGISIARTFMVSSSFFGFYEYAMAHIL